MTTRSALGRAHVPPTKVFRRLTVNKAILKARIAAATGSQYIYVGFSKRNKILCSSTYTISEKAMRFWHRTIMRIKLKSESVVHVPTSVDTQHFMQINARVFE